MGDYAAAIAELESFVGANDGKGLNAQAFGRLSDIARQAFADMEKHAEEARGMNADSVGQMGERAAERLKNVRADLSDLDRSLRIMEASAGRRKGDSTYSLAVGRLRQIRDGLEGRLSAFETSSALERTVVEQRKEARLARRPSPVLAFISNLFTRRQPAAEGIIVKVSEMEGGRRVRRRVLLEPVRPGEPQMPPEGTYVSVNGKRYLYDAHTDAYYRRRYRHIVEVVTAHEAYELQRGERREAKHAEPFAELEYARIGRMKETFRFKELFQMLPPALRRGPGAPAKPAPPKLRLAGAH